MKKIIKNIVALIFWIGVLWISINLYVIQSASPYVYENREELPASSDAVLILWARVFPEKLSQVLKQRVDSGVAVYTEWLSRKILISGDHARKDYDEVNTIRKYILKNYPEKVKPEDIFMDHAGFDTYDSIYRAKNIFEVKSMTIVTQRFHVYRAVYMARALWIDAHGIILDEKQFGWHNIIFWNLRESIARSKSFFDVALDVGSQFLWQKIPITGDGHLSWDEKDS